MKASEIFKEAQSLSDQDLEAEGEPRCPAARFIDSVITRRLSEVERAHALVKAYMLIAGHDFDRALALAEAQEQGSEK